ncbi:helix-turn-helix domain-containing protein [Plantibacter sp. Mn2098]|uniref:helix-turn-helix domain-containing protein n=1 Tax=Plantibacter sp. Mn2098 TaxID=3395266 RepID=UPI003BD60B6D
MFVIIADQVASRTTEDLAGQALAAIHERHADQLALPADRTAGDEIQVITADAATAIALALELTRDGAWSVGLGQGAIRTPLPAETRVATGPAFYAARDAVERAKKAPTRFAFTASSETPAEPVEPGNHQDHRATAQSGEDIEAFLVLILMLRQRRTAGGWQVADLLAEGTTQTEIAEQLGLSESSVSRRVSAAGVRAEQSASEAAVRLLEQLDERTGAGPR